MTGPSRRERERERHRDEVLGAAEAVFAEKGFAGATVQEIATLADFAVGSLYNLFESKEDLYQRLMELRFQEYFEQVEDRVHAAEGLREKVRAAIETKVGFFREHGAFFRIFSHAIGGRNSGAPQGLPEGCIAMCQRHMEAMAGIFAEGIGSGVFRPGDPMLIALAVDGMTNAMIGHTLFTGQELIDDATAGRLEDLLFHGILREGGAE